MPGPTAAAIQAPAARTGEMERRQTRRQCARQRLHARISDSVPCRAASGPTLRAKLRRMGRLSHILASEGRWMGAAAHLPVRSCAGRTREAREPAPPRRQLRCGSLRAPRHRAHGRTRPQRQRRDGWHRQPPHSRGRAGLSPARRGCRGPQPMSRAACTRRRRKVTNGGQRRTQPRYSEVLGASGEAQRTRQPDARRHSRSDRRQQPGPHAPTRCTVGACERGCSRNAHEAQRSAAPSRSQSRSRSSAAVPSSSARTISAWVTAAERAEWLAGDRTATGPWACERTCAGRCVCVGG